MSIFSVHNAIANINFIININFEVLTEVPFIPIETI